MPDASAENGKLVGMIGLFDDPDQPHRSRRVGARRRMDERWDCHTPYPVHGLDDAMGLKPSQAALRHLPRRRLHRRRALRSYMM